MIRSVKPELLDSLPATDPDAIASRRDLQRLNRRMHSALILARELRKCFPGNAPKRVLEIGAGDGTLLLKVARQLPEWRAIHLSLLDQQNLLSEETMREYRSLGWHAEALRADVFHWAGRPMSGEYDVIIANLVLHHFTDPQLASLLPALARRTAVFVALEPHRYIPFLIVTHLLWLMGCNHVTRYDAKVSVRAGFDGHELSRYWPATKKWNLREGPTGFFNHLFVAVRTRETHATRAS